MLVTYYNKYKKIKESNLPTFILFTDYEKAHNNVQQMLNADKILSRLLLATNSLYRNTTIKIKERKVTELELHNNKLIHTFYMQQTK
jgi:hypothetical protein